MIFVFMMGVYSSSTVFAEQAAGKSQWQVISDRICGGKLCDELESNIVLSISSSIAYFPPPLKQISQGTAFKCYLY